MVPVGARTSATTHGHLPGAAVASWQRPCLPVLDLTDFKRDLSELTDRLGHAQDCL
jgi:peptide chain release factor 2